MAIDPLAFPRLARGVRMRLDPVTRRPVLLYPEGALPLDEITFDILSRCTGAKRVEAIIESLEEEYESDGEMLRQETTECIEQLRRRMLIRVEAEPEGDFAGAAPSFAPFQSGAGDESPATCGKYRPYLLLAELTYQCPLHCPYCSNPFPIVGRPELSTVDWLRVIREAASTGVLHVGLSGGEPLQRRDLEELIAAARALELYTNLITSGVGFTARRGEQLKAAGLDNVQISFQSDEESLADRIAGTSSHRAKLEAARVARDLGFPLTINVVLHRANIARVEQVIRFAAGLGAERLELANTQYYGWAFRNRTELLPSREQIETAARIAARAKEDFAGRMDITFVTPDYFTERPKPCMHGWGARFLTVNPFGDVLPCPTAGEIKGMRFDNVQSRPLEWIWHESEAFNRFRGTGWMPETCRECPLHEVDFGGCRCQAALILGEASAVDPACSLSPGREELLRFVQSCQEAGAGPGESAVPVWRFARGNGPAK